MIDGVGKWCRYGESWEEAWRRRRRRRMVEALRLEMAWVVTGTWMLKVRAKSKVEEISGKCMTCSLVAK
jgi:hypothetical protein